MRTYWFKSMFVSDILRGAKRDTIRKATRGLPKIGERIALSIGPTKPFATAMVTSVERISTFHDDRREQLLDIYGDTDDLFMIGFELEPTQTGTSTS